MSSLKLSIIIPVYNLEGYIKETLDSCLCQDMDKSEYEIICIDDGSKDKSAEIIEEYIKISPNIVLFKKPNGGVSSARNKGLEFAKGEYVWFVDGDDLIAPNCLNYLYNSIKDCNGDLLWFQINSFEDNPVFNNVFIDDVKVCNDSGKKYDFMFSNGGGGVWSKWFNNELLKSNCLSFDEEIKYSEDVLFGFEALIYASVCVKTDNVCYFYRQRAGSAMHSNKLDLHSGSMLNLAVAYDDLAKKEADLKNMLVSKRNSAVKAMLFSIMRTGDVPNAKAKIKQLKELGFYPYKFQKNSLRGNETKKQFLINLVSFLFPIKCYFMLCVRLFSLKRKK